MAKKQPIEIGQKVRAYVKEKRYFYLEISNEVTSQFITMNEYELSKHILDLKVCLEEMQNG